MKELATTYRDPYEASDGTHALVICTEWDQFMVGAPLDMLFGTLNSKNGWEVYQKTLLWHLVYMV